MNNRTKYQERYKTERGLINFYKEVRRNRRIRKKRKKAIVKKSVKGSDYSWSKEFKYNLIHGRRRILHSSNIRHILSLDEKLGLSKFKARFTKKNVNFFGSKIEQTRTFDIPEYFSLSEKPKESFDFIYSLFVVLYWETARTIILDYSKCNRIDLDAQVFMDVLLSDFFSYHDKCRKHGRHNNVSRVEPRNFDKDNIIKILFSIGSFKLFAGQEIKFPNIIPYHLCVGNKKMRGTIREISSQKEIHTTKLIDYVIACLNRVARKLTPEARSELCQVVGEILINAEEHSTTDNRFSIGFFEETNESNNHYGIFNLVIFNFGQTIYEKFKDPNCPTQHIVKRMEELSEHYTRKGFFSPAHFEEETLWTLYALQEGVTSKINYKKRGNGSIRFIESFFNLKGIGLFRDNVSKLTIHSGNARITFDGEYEISEKIAGNNKFRVIAFNKSGNIEELPDKKYVTFAANYFPGTMITAVIRIGEEDLERK